MNSFSRNILGFVRNPLSSDNAFLSGTLLSLVSRGAGLAGNLALIALTSRALGPDDFGFWVIIFGWMSFCVALDLGAGNAFQTLFSRQHARDDTLGLAAAYIGARRVCACIGAGIGILGVLVVLMLANVAGEQVCRKIAAHPHLFVAIGFAPIFMLLAVCSQRRLLAERAFVRFNIALLLTSLVQIFAAGILFWLKATLFWFCLVPLVGGLAGFLFADWRNASGKILRQSKRSSWTFTELRIAAGRSAAGYVLPQVMAQAMAFLPPIIVANVAGLAVAGTFGAMLRVVGSFAQIASVMALPLRPLLTHAHSVGDIFTCRKLVKKALTTTAMIYGPIAVCFCVAGPTMLAFWMGHGNATFGLVEVFWMALYLLILALCQPLAAFLNGIDALRGQAIYGTTTVVISLFAIGPLVHLFGVAGGLMALTIPLLLVNFPFAAFETVSYLRAAR